MDAIWALGLMSGTSMDGIDGATLLTDGVEIGAFGPKHFLPFAPEQTAVLRAVLGSWPEDDLGEAPALVQALHEEAAQYFPTADVIGFHGQTLAHDPGAQRSHQLGDGAALADALGKTVVWDFRSADLASGGEGAPLVPVFHFALAQMLGLSEPVAFLNIGGVANVTWVDPRVARAEAEGAMLAFDTGPGNAMINDFLKQRLDAEFDKDGALAAEGQVDLGIVEGALSHPYFDRVPPKSLDRDDFKEVLERVGPLSTEDGAATLTAVTAESIVLAARHMPEPPSRWLICGGGRHNATIMAMLAARTNAPVDPVDVLGLDGDMLEAQAFAYLAVRVLRELPTSFPSTTAARLPVCGGRVSQSVV
ncbi:anhydro-N-acetylmuramic acid kinase [Halovulum sp. GXIMD14793]